MNREELFDLANKKYKKEKEEREQKAGGKSFSFTPIDYVGLSLVEYSQFRILGNPLHVRLDDPYSPKKINYSMILGDDQKLFRCIWPDPVEHSDWILWRVFNKVMAYTYDKASNSRIFHNKEKCPSIFNRVFKNDKVENNFEKGWKPTTYVVMNVIDRKHYLEHQASKKTFVLSKKVSEDGMWSDPGVPPLLYNLIYDEIVQFNGDFQNYDIVATKLGADPWYKVYHPVDDKKKFISSFPDFKEDVAIRPLTEEELSWKRWNLDSAFQITSYSKIYKKLKLFISQIDETFKVSYLKDLEAFAEEEKKTSGNVSDDDEPALPKELKKEKESVARVNLVDEEDIENSLSIPEVDESKPQDVRPRQPKVEINLDSTKYLGFSALSVENKSMIVGEQGDELIYKEEAGTLYKCSIESCRFKAPESFSHCPKCGIAF